MPNHTSDCSPLCTLGVGHIHACLETIHGSPGTGQSHICLDAHSDVFLLGKTALAWLHTHATLGCQATRTHWPLSLGNGNRLHVQTPLYCAELWYTSVLGDWSHDWPLYSVPIVILVNILKYWLSRPGYSP